MQHDNDLGKNDLRIFLVHVDRRCHFSLIFSNAASYQNPPGTQNENDPNNTTVGTPIIFNSNIISWTYLWVIIWFCFRYSWGIWILMSLMSTWDKYSVSMESWCMLRFLQANDVALFNFQTGWYFQKLSWHLRPFFPSCGVHLLMSFVFCFP